MLAAFWRVQPFLAATHKVPARYLVLEGWLPDYAFEAAVEEFRAGGYQQVFTTGGPLRKSHGLVFRGDYAQRAEAALRSLGLSTNEVTAVSAPATRRNRTYVSAKALRDHCAAQGVRLGSVNLVSLGVHARRSRLCFQQALGKDAQVGVISVENLDYDPGRWWKFSEGVKEVAGETIAFTYAWLTIDHGD